VEESTNAGRQGEERERRGRSICLIPTLLLPFSKIKILGMTALGEEGRIQRG
jgi:hypothetical protein